MPQCIALIVPKRHVERVRKALEAENKFGHRIKRDAATDGLVVSTAFETKAAAEHFCTKCELQVQIEQVDLVGSVQPAYNGKERSRLAAVIHNWCVEHDFPLSEQDQRAATGYSIYGTLLLIPSGTSPVWETISAHRDLLAHIASQMKCTHIALNAHISTAAGTEQRSPTGLRPLYGDFGPVCPAEPTNDDFAQAFWTNTTQNGITQVWAPRYTMFSRGNISEKARVRNMPSVKAAIEQGKESGRGCSAVDLYAGIGYFAFSYLAAGVDTVLCWDINAWSIEGLRRGAAANGWVCTKERDPEPGMVVRAYHASNVTASTIVHDLRESIPPVRHVNCGLLPTSRDSYGIAVDVLDPQLGGWVHIHENFGIDEIGRKAEAVRHELQRLVDIRHPGRKVELEHIQRVKSFAPGVLHCVMDIYISPHDE